MTITRVTDGNTSAATNLNQLIDLMEGAETIDYLLKSLTATDFKVRLADAAGARKLIIQDSAGATVATIDSDGNATFTSMTLTSFVLPTAASPAQTADGSIVWDSDDDYLTIGTGSARKSFQPANQGSNIASASSITVTDRYHRVTGTTTITAISTKPAGFHLTLTFAGALQLTHSAGLSLAGAANYTTTAEETLEFESDGTNWREVGRKPPTAATNWTKVSAGAGTATGLTLSSLSGYRRYNLKLYIESLGAAVTVQFNGVSTANYNYQRLSVDSSTGNPSSLLATSQTSGAIIDLGYGAAPDTYIDINVGHNGGASSKIAYSAVASLYANVVTGWLNTDQSSITSIVLSWTSSLVYNYVLFGSNDVS